MYIISINLGTMHFLISSNMVWCYSFLRNFCILTSFVTIRFLLGIIKCVYMRLSFLYPWVLFLSVLSKYFIIMEQKNDMHLLSKSDNFYVIVYCLTFLTCLQIGSQTKYVKHISFLLSLGQNFLIQECYLIHFCVVCIHAYFWNFIHIWALLKNGNYK